MLRAFDKKYGNRKETSPCDASLRYASSVEVTAVIGKKKGVGRAALRAALPTPNPNQNNCYVG